MRILISLRRTAFLSLAVWACIAFALAADAKEKPPDLQRLVNETPSGSTLRLPAGRYAGPVEIAKKIAIQAVGEVEIENNSDQPAFTLQGEGIELIGLTITDWQTDPKIPAVAVYSNGNRLHNLTIRTMAGGIQLRKAHRNIVSANTVIGLEASGGGSREYSLRGNGIDLYESDENVISENTIDHMHDGVYAESSNKNRMIRNRVTHSRYGYHFMFAENPVLLDNTGVFNVTGAMVMAVDKAEVRNNRFTKQSENVNSQGLLLYDVKNSLFQNNVVEGNRIGIYVEQSKDNRLIGNEIKRNFVGLQMWRSQRNDLWENEFVANVTQAQSVESSDNQSNGNYWDNVQGLDITADGRSDLPFEINPFFLRLTESVPAFQVFFQSPGMPFLEQLFYTDTRDWMKDRSPLMKPPGSQGEEESRRDPVVFWTGMLLIAASLLSIYQLGVKRT